MEQLILSVDLGINSSATCSVLKSDGTVLGRHILKLPKEYDSLNHKIDHIKRAQRHGSRKVSNLWAYAKGVNDDIAVKTAKFIMDVAVLYDVDCIVFEHLDTGKKKRGSKKQRLALWKARYVQSMVEHKAHVNGMHISRINAWGTSKLAFDGSGTVLRGKKSERTNGNYSVCEFQNGKIYNCDLSASYNIGARYFVREILKTLPARDRQRIEAKVPGCVKRSTCTLATLISLNGELGFAKPGIAV
jgi:IS605 OrfB family transposase